MFLYYYVFKNFPSSKQFFIQTLALVQGVYFFVTGLWPIVDIHSFMLITGPKTDIWLVKMVGALTIVVSLLLLLTAKKKRVTIESLVIIFGSSIAYFIIDVVYFLERKISYVYLGDAGLQVIFIILWIQWLIKIRFRLRSYKLWS